MGCVPQVVIVTLGRPVFDNSTNDLQYEVTFVPNMRHQSKTANFYKRHVNATGSPKVRRSPSTPVLPPSFHCIHAKRPGLIDCPYLTHPCFPLLISRDGEVQRGPCSRLVFCI